MLKKLVLLLAALFVTMSAAFAGPVDVNTADQATLQTLKGLGPVKSKAIVDERTKNGPFKNADDLAQRVTGLGQKSVTKLEQEGLTIGGSSAPPTGASAKHEKAAAPATAPAAKPSQTTAVKSAPPAAVASPAVTNAASDNAQPSKSKKQKQKKDKAKAASAASGT